MIDPDRGVVTEHVANQRKSVDSDPLDDLVVGGPIVDFAGQHWDGNGDDHLGTATRLVLKGRTVSRKPRQVSERPSPARTDTKGW